MAGMTPTSLAVAKAKLSTIS